MRTVMYETLANAQNPRTLLVVVVYLSLFLDNLLLTVVGKFQTIASDKTILDWKFTPNLSSLKRKFCIFITINKMFANIFGYCLWLIKDFRCIYFVTSTLCKLLLIWNSRWFWVIVLAVYFKISDVRNVMNIAVPVIPDYLCTIDNNSTCQDENGRVGFLLSSRAFVQLVLNPVVGSYIGAKGYSKPLFFGNLCLLLAAMCE